MSKKCIIIGSGFGGLSCAVMLLKNGYDVTVLEQSNNIGGCLQCFTRNGATFETGMHFIGSADKGQTMYQIMNYLGLSDIPLRRLDTQGYEEISLAGNHFKYANGREPFIDSLAEYFPKERENLQRYYDLIEHVANASRLHSLRNTEDESMLDIKYQLTSIDEVLDSIFEDEMLKNVLMGNSSLYAAEKSKTPFSTHAFIQDFYNQSAFRVVGGSGLIAERLKEIIESLGGRVQKRKKVVKILVDDTKATGVLTSDGEHFSADYIIGAMHPKRLIELTDTPLLRSAYRKRISNLPETIGCFTMYLHFKENTVKYMNHNFYGYVNSSPWNCEKYTSLDKGSDDKNAYPMGYLYMHLCDDMQQKWAHSGVLITYMRMSDVEKWKGTTVGRRGEDYEEFKRRHAERLLDVLAKEFPNIRDCIAEYYTSTPLTYLNYTGTEDGAMYGVARDITLGSACRVHHRTKIPNVLLTGQNINSHGILGVTVGSIVTCGELIGSERLFKDMSL